MITNNTKVVKDQVSDKKVEVKPSDAAEKKEVKNDVSDAAKKNV